MEIRVHIAVLVIAADPNHPDPAAADVVAQKAVAGGHSIVARATVGDSVDAIRAQLQKWIADSEIDVAIVTAGNDTQHASAALKPLVAEMVPGFTDLFRWLAFQEIGASAMMASAEAARCGTTFVFVLPAVANAAAAAMDKLILPQLEVRSTTRNLVAQMPRLQHLHPRASDAAALVPSAPVIADAATDKTEAVPHAVSMERTESGPGLSPRRPAPNVVRKEPAPIKPKAEDKTRVISQEQLERKIAQSNQHDAVTRPNVDIAKLLPRLPPGADDLDDDGGDTADFTDVISPFKAGDAPPSRKPPTVQIPQRTKPPTNVPIVLKKDESGRVMIPLKDAGSGAIGRAKLAPTIDEVPTIPSKTPARIAESMKPKPRATTPPPKPTATPPKGVEPAKPVEAAKPVEVAKPVEPVAEPEPIVETKPEAKPEAKIEPSARSSTSLPIRRRRARRSLRAAAAAASHDGEHATAGAGDRRDPRAHTRADAAAAVAEAVEGR